MITGRVTWDTEAVVSVNVQAPNGREHVVAAVIDTGFSEFMALSPDQIAGLGLPYRGTDRATLADGSETVLRVYSAVVVWHGVPFLLPVFQSEAGALLGMALLRGSLLTVEIIEGGHVQIQPLGLP